MKKIYLSLIVCFLGLFISSFFTTVKAETEEVKDPNALATELFTKYYNEGSYKKDTTINVNDEVLEEIKDCFHSSINILERTTYYNVDELWMSNGKGYSGYGTTTVGEDTYLTSFRVDRNRSKGNESQSAIAGGMEGYYCTLHDFKEGKHDSAHVEEEIILNAGWSANDSVLYSQSKDIIEGYRLFTAPLWLNNDASKNYVTFSLVTLEEESLESSAKVSKNTSRLVMKLWASASDKAKVANKETFVVGEGEDATTHYLFSKAYIYTDYITNLEGNGTESDPYLIQNVDDWNTFGQNAAEGYKYNGEYAKLTADITVTEPIFKETDHAFRGTLDGNDKTITADIDNGTIYSAVIGYTGRKVSNNSIPTVKNLTVEGKVEGANRSAGIVALHYGEMVNCTNKANVTGTEEIGGLVGYLCIGAKINNCINEGNIIGTTSVGGVSGFTGGSSIVNNCTNKGTVKGDTTVGGIIGIASATLEISNNVNEGEVIGNASTSGKGIGGIVGFVEKTVKITNCVNKGNVTFNNDGYNAAGIVGVIGTEKGTGEKAIVDNCTNSAKITAGRYIGGIVAQNYEGVIINCTNSGEIYGTAPADNNFYLGGICGRSYSSNDITQEFTIKIYTSMTEYTQTKVELTGTIVNCSNSGKVHGNTEYTTQYLIGGIVGSLNSGTSTGVVVACYNSGEVIGSAKTAGIVGFASASTPKDSLKYCYQLGATVKNLSGKVQTSRYSSGDTKVCLYIGKAGSATNLPAYLISDASAQPNATQLQEGYCAYYTK